MSLVMNTAIGTWNGGKSALDGKHWPASFFVDYVRVWQKKEATNVGCNPPDFPTKTYIEANAPNFGEWVTPTGYETCPEIYPKAAYDNAEAIKARPPAANVQIARRASPTGSSAPSSPCASRLRPSRFPPFLTSLLTVPRTLLDGPQARGATIKGLAATTLTAAHYGATAKAEILATLAQGQPTAAKRSYAPYAAVFLVVAGMAGLLWRRANGASGYAPSALGTLTEPLAEGELSGEYELAR